MKKIFGLIAFDPTKRSTVKHHSTIYYSAHLYSQKPCTFDIEQKTCQHFRTVRPANVKTNSAKTTFP